ncbi:MAG: class I SAM-dependent methyltransferase [Candidatus Levybacteria bacterium]|nr:class I SAM-dependent methyltransferase [Candidatus Levybacteria bacterium]
MVDIICALCGKNQRTEVLYKSTFNKRQITSVTYSARRPPDRIHYKILKCQKCGLIFSSPVLEPSKITEFYRESVCSYDEQIPYLIKAYMREFQRIEPFLPQNPKILEIGCGNGFFLEALKKRGIKDLFGVEPSPKMVSEAPSYLKKRITSDVFKQKQFPNNNFDAVLCFHTLDHVVNLNKFIKSVREILKPGGFIFFVVHNTDSIFAKLFGEKWPIFDIEHIVLFNKKTLRTLFSKHQFINIQTLDVRNFYPLSYYVNMSPISLKIKNILLNILNKFKLQNISFPLVGSNIGIIAQKK